MNKANYKKYIKRMNNGIVPKAFINLSNAFNGLGHSIPGVKQALELASKEEENAIRRLCK